MLINGEKFACESCVKGHRVSNCTHSDRPLKHIAPKGRPVKQCEHCRDARKSKSHHVKCDCGSKRAKDKIKSEPKSEDRGCCCHQGTECVCNSRADPLELRLETSLNRSVQNAKTKPKLTITHSDPTLATFANGHHKPLHRHNNLAHVSGVPYKIPRPHTLHGASAFEEARRAVNDDGLQRSADDLLLLNGSSNKFYTSAGAQISADDLRLSSQAAYMETMLASTSGSSGNVSEDELSHSTSTDMLSSTMSWFDSGLPAVAEGTEDFPNMCSASATGVSDWEWNNIPSATTEFFSPSDLPLIPDPNQCNPDYAQPISHSGESSYRSAPGLTASSSGAQSEVAFPIDANTTSIPMDNDVLNSYWNDNLVVRPPYDNQPEIGNGFSFPIANMETPSINQQGSKSPIDDYTFCSPPSSHTHKLSDSTAVPDGSAATDDTGVNAGHLANLASLSSSQVLAESFENADITNLDAEPGSIMIPVGSDDSDSYWNFPTNPPNTGADQAGQYAWLQTYARVLTFFALRFEPELLQWNHHLLLLFCRMFAPMGSRVLFVTGRFIGYHLRLVYFFQIRCAVATYLSYMCIFKMNNSEHMGGWLGFLSIYRLCSDDFTLH